jgi:predicted nucleic acid-binding protein
MSGFLLDTNHLSAAIDYDHPIRRQLKKSHRAGARMGTCVPVLCEVEAGIAGMRRTHEARESLKNLLRFIRIWPVEPRVAPIFGELYWELRRRGRALSQIDMILASMARADGLTILSADEDFDAVDKLRRENWLQ